jgi:hypothetical protein
MLAFPKIKRKFSISKDDSVYDQLLTIVSDEGGCVFNGRREIRVLAGKESNSPRDCGGGVVFRGVLGDQIGSETGDVWSGHAGTAEGLRTAIARPNPGACDILARGKDIEG